VPPERLDWVTINTEHLKRVYDDLLAEAGADVLFHSTLCAVDAEDGRVTAATVANKAGLTAQKARVYVDCTGDADLAAWAGAEFHKGDDAGGGNGDVHAVDTSRLRARLKQHGAYLP